MIKSFRSRIMQRAFGGDMRRVSPNFAARFEDILTTLNLAESLAEVEQLTGFHALRQNRAGEYAVTVTRNWRITFTVGTEIIFDIDTKEQRDEFHVYDINYEDYH